MGTRLYIATSKRFYSALAIAAALGAPARSLRAESVPSVDQLMSAFSNQSSSASSASSPQDRKQGAGTAAALAAAGAAMAGLGCIQLLKAAQEEEDETMKALLTSQAMQQCAQAAQDAANASQNSSGESQMASNNTPTQQQLSASSDPASSGASSSAPDLGNLDQGSASSALDPQLASTDPLSLPATIPVDSGGASSSSGSLASVPPPIGADGNSTTSLQPIPGQQVQFDDSNNGNNPTSNASQPSFGMFGGGSSAGGPTTLSDTLTKLAQGLPSADAVSGRRGTAKEDGAGGGGGGSDGGKASEDSGDNGGFSAMLAQMMGGGKTDSPGGDGLAGLFIVGAGVGASAGADAASVHKPNIFQYAGYRFHKYRSEAVIGPPPKRVLASKAAPPRSVP